MIGQTFALLSGVSALRNSLPMPSLISCLGVKTHRDIRDVSRCSNFGIYYSGYFVKLHSLTLSVDAKAGDA